MEIINAATEKHYEGIKLFGEFIGAESIEYRDLGNGEDYIITKNKETIIISARGNKFDGGWVNFYRK